MKKCPQCGFELNDNAKFCEECGAPIPQEKECPNCHTKARPSAKFCMECGYSFSGNAPAGAKLDASVSVGDKSMVAGDVIGKKVVVEKGATFIHNEDETRKLVQCHICNRNMALSDSNVCPKCHEITCEDCYDRSVPICLKCKETEYSSAMQKAMLNGRITLEKRAELDRLFRTLNLSPEKAKEIEQRHRNSPVGNKDAACDDSRQRFILHALEKTESLLFDWSNPLAAYSLLKPIHEDDPYQEDILVDYILAAQEVSPEEAGGLLRKINADILGVELIRIDQALTENNVLAAVNLLNKADEKWPGNILLDCRNILVRKAMYDKTGEHSWLDEANALLASMKEPETKMERSWVEKAKRGMGYDLPEPSPTYCREHDLFYFVLNSDSGAFYRLALCREQDKEEYSRLIRLAAKSPSPSTEVLKRFAQCLSLEKKAKQGIEETLRPYWKVAERWDAETQYRFGTCFYKGDGVDKDDAEAVKWYRKAAESGYAASQSILGICYDTGQGVDKDDAEAVKWFRKAAGQGNAEAQYNLGKCFEEGRGVEKDVAEAMKWYSKAAEQGNVEAQKAMESLKDVIDLIARAEHGNADAQYRLGKCYMSGSGVRKDPAEAVKWYRKAAEQGNSEAQDDLGKCYLNGEGVPQDCAIAVQWFHYAAEQGNSEAQDDLGFCYEKGYGVAKDLSMATKWYRKAAEQGCRRAQGVLEGWKKPYKKPYMKSSVGDFNLYDIFE